MVPANTQVRGKAPVMETTPPYRRLPLRLQQRLDCLMRAACWPRPLPLRGSLPHPEAWHLNRHVPSPFVLVRAAALIPCLSLTCTNIKRTAPILCASDKQTLTSTQTLHTGLHHLGAYWGKQSTGYLPTSSLGHGAAAAKAALLVPLHTPHTLHKAGT